MMNERAQIETIGEAARIAGVKTRPGFTLVEVLIVVSIISIIAAVAIPNLLRARMTANEGAAIGTMRTLSSAQQQFQSSATLPFGSGMGQYAPSIAALAATTPTSIDSALATTNKQGYNFATVGGGVDGAPTFTANGNPILMGRSGARGFFCNESGLITYLPNGVATAGDNPVN